MGKSAKREVSDIIGDIVRQHGRAIRKGLKEYESLPEIEKRQYFLFGSEEHNKIGEGINEEEFYNGILDKKTKLHETKNLETSIDKLHESLENHIENRASYLKEKPWIHDGKALWFPVFAINEINTAPLFGINFKRFENWAIGPDSLDFLAPMYHGIRQLEPVNSCSSLPYEEDLMGPILQHMSGFDIIRFIYGFGKATKNHYKEKKSFESLNDFFNYFINFGDNIKFLFEEKERVSLQITKKFLEAITRDETLNDIIARYYSYRNSNDNIVNSKKSGWWEDYHKESKRNAGKIYLKHVKLYLAKREFNRNVPF